MSRYHDAHLRIHIYTCETGLPGVGEAVPQALSVAPEQPVEDAVKEPVEVKTLHIGLPPDPLQRWAYIGTNNVQHLSGDGGERESNKGV